MKWQALDQIFVCDCLRISQNGSGGLRTSIHYMSAQALLLTVIAAMSRNIFDPSALVATLPNILPPSKKSLQSSQDAIAALVHSALTIIGFRLLGVDESSPDRTFVQNQLPEEWNLHGPGSYVFRYKHEQSSLEFLVKVSKLGSRIVIYAIALEVRKLLNVKGRLFKVHIQTDKTASLDIRTDEFVSPAFFPHEITSTSEPVVHGFISSNRIADFMSQFQLMIIQKLMPGLQKEGYVEQAADSSTTTGQGPSQPRNPPPARPEPATPPYGPDRFSPLQVPPRNPLEIGRSDLEPFPRNPFAPPSLFPGSEGDGMFMGPNHPIFGPGLGGRGGRGPWGGDGYLPPMGAPPGARFDPVGPFPRNGRGMPGAGNTRDPDFDDFPPPGSVSSL